MMLAYYYDYNYYDDGDEDYEWTMDRTTDSMIVTSEGKRYAPAKRIRSFGTVYGDVVTLAKIYVVTDIWWYWLGRIRIET